MCKLWGVLFGKLGLEAKQDRLTGTNNWVGLQNDKKDESTLVNGTDNKAVFATWES